jgi:ornithine cyclodeaminase/alanine dehydrogenase-like protein (mu-crystallin family)
VVSTAIAGLLAVPPRPARVTTVVIAVPSHWLLALSFTGAFVLVAIGTGLAAVWHLRSWPRGQRLQELSVASRSAASAIRRRHGSRGKRQAS